MAHYEWGEGERRGKSIADQGKGDEGKVKGNKGDNGDRRKARKREEEKGREKENWKRTG